MTIYLDYIFIENLLIDYILLYETGYISKINFRNRNLLASSIIASVYIVIMMYFNIGKFNLVICKLLLVNIMVYISFKPIRLNEYVKYIIIFLLVNVVNVGSVIVITMIFNLSEATGILKIITYVISFIIAKILMVCMWNIYKREIKNDDLIYDVNIHINGKVYKYKAFLDTGNNVFSYSNNLPVIFAELKDKQILKEIENKEYFYINTITLSNKSEKKAYVLDEVEIIKKDKRWHVKVAIIFEDMKLSKDSSYDMLLNYILYTESLGGIKI